MHPYTSFNISAVISFIITIAVMIIYNYYTIMKPNQLIPRFVLKPLPVLSMIINICFYYCTRHVDFYALLIQVSLLFCLLGDILLMLYIPTIDEKYNNVLFLLIGGASFFVAKGLMSLALCIYPFRNVNKKCITVSVKRMAITSIFSFLYTGFIIGYFLINMKPSVIKYLLPVYFIMMGLQLNLSILRIGGFEEETPASQLKGMIGTTFFTISDVILFWGLFISPIDFGDNISICLYWLGMYFLTISVVRTNNQYKYKIMLNDNQPLNNEIQ